MSRKPKSVEDLEFEHRARQFYLGCANHALPLAPLPEFKDALALLEFYDDAPNDENREELKKAYRALWSKRTRRDYGYTAVGEFYFGLRHILYCTLYKTDSVASYDGQRFTEAAYCAGHSLRCSTVKSDIGYRAQQTAYEWQSKSYKELFRDKVPETVSETKEVSAAA